MGVLDNKPRTRRGIKGGYQLDHIISIKHGFETDISSEDLSKLDNRFIPWKENLIKGSSCGC